MATAKQQNFHEVEKLPEGASERYSLYQHQIEHETDNHNQKIIYHVISQSFFFGAYSSLMNAPKDPKNPIFASQQDVLLWVLPIAAILIAAFTATSIVSSLLYVKQLTHSYEETYGKTPEGLPNVNKESRLRKMAVVSSYGLPASIIVAWIVILSFQVGNYLRS